MTTVASIIKYLSLLLPIVLLCWEYKLKYIVNDGRTTEHKRTRKSVLFLAICIFAFGLLATIIEDSNKAKKEKSLAESNAHLNQQLNEIRTNLPNEVSKGVNADVNRLLSQATNSSLGDAALSASVQDLAATINDKQQIEAKFEAINTDNLDTSEWKTRYENKLAIAKLNQEKEAQEAELARREADKANQKAELEAQKSAKEAAEKSALEAKLQEKFINERTRPVFDYAIRNLLILVGRAKLGDETPVTTYRGLPSVIDSPFQEIGQISTGDKSPWLIDMFVSQSPRTLVIGCADIRFNNTNALAITGRLIKRSLTPANNINQKYAARSPNIIGRFNYFITLTISFQDENFETISYSMAIQSKTTEPYPSMENKQPYTNYTKCVDAALGNFIGAHQVVIEHMPK